MKLKARKLKEMPGKERGDKLAELRLELSKERAASEIGTVKNPGRIKDIRKTIARILTVENTKKEAKKK
jgi:large subunit ribosomal protein L29